MNNKIVNLNKHEDFIALENVKDLYSILDYKPILIRTEFDYNYLEYGSDGNNSLSFNGIFKFNKAIFRGFIK